jgi:hypothetical protein
MGDVLSMRPGGEPRGETGASGTFGCEHMTVSGVVMSASCGICGPLAQVR